jgi:hypothetical protein
MEPAYEYKLLDWIEPEKLDWCWLCENPNAISLLERNEDETYWDVLSRNPNAIPLLEKNADQIVWHYLSANPNAIWLLKNNVDKIDWYGLLENPIQNERVMTLVDNQGKIDRMDWYLFKKNNSMVKFRKFFPYTMSYLE